MTTLAIANSPGHGMLGSHPEGDYALPGQVFLSSTDIPPESLVYGHNIEVGDTITFTTTALAGGIQACCRSTLGVPVTVLMAPRYNRIGSTKQRGAGSVLYFASTDEATIEAQFNYLPLDADGWSIITPSADSRLIYVDATNGNDATGTHYLPSTLPNVDNWHDPGAVQPYQTFSAALAEKRQDYPDWILLKRGEEFSFSGRQNLKNGRSIAQKPVLSDGAFTHPA